MTTTFEFTRDSLLESTLPNMKTHLIPFGDGFFEIPYTSQGELSKRNLAVSINEVKQMARHNNARDRLQAKLKAKYQNQ